MRKQVYLPLLAAAAVLGTTSLAQAQVTIGPRIGLNLANFAYGDDIDIDTKLLPAPQLGVGLNVAFGNLAFQPALLFSQKGYRINEEETNGNFKQQIEVTSRLNYLELPLNLVYTTGGTEGFQVFAGPYVGIGLGGKERAKYSYSDPRGSGSDSESANVRFANEEKANSDEIYYRQPDLGLNGGIGYKTGPLQVQLGYSLGLSNLIPENSNPVLPDASAKNRVIQLSMNYFFSTK